VLYLKLRTAVVQQLLVLACIRGCMKRLVLAGSCGCWTALLAATRLPVHCQSMAMAVVEAECAWCTCLGKVMTL
jgi:hypothetical protein